MLKNRILYGIMVIIGMSFCYIYQSPTVSLFGYVLLLLPIVSLVYTLWAYTTLTYTQDVDKAFITKGESIKFLFSIHNESRWVYPHIEVIFYGVDSILTQYFESKRMSIDGRDQKRYDYEIACKYRGYYEVGIRQIYMTDFLGLFRIPCKVLNPKGVTVYPRIIPLVDFPLLDQDGEHSDLDKEKSMGSGNLFSNIRSYVYGDSMKQVHWKISAKRQELMIKERQSVSPSGTYIFLDLSRHTYDIETNTIIEDKLIECAVAIIYYCLRHNRPIQFIYHTNQLMTHAAKDEGAFESIYKQLFKFKFEGEVSLEQVLALNLVERRGMSNQVLITSHLTYELYEQVEALVKEGCHVILIYISPYKGRDEEDETGQVVLKALYKLSIICIYSAFEEDLEKVL